MDNLILLLKLKLLRASRKSLFAKLFFKRTVNVKQGIFIKISGYFFFIFAFYILAFLYPGPSIFKEIIYGVMNSKHIVINVLWIFHFYFGLFIGANLIYEFTILDNFSYLTLPILIKDLGCFRITESVSTVIKFFLYFMLPFYFSFYSYRGLAFYRIIVFIILLLLIYLSSFLYGNVIILLMAKAFKRISPDRLFIAIFISSCWIFVVVFRLMKSLPPDSILHKVLNFLGSIFANFSFVEVVANTIPTKQMSLLLFFIAIVLITLINYLLILLFNKLLLNAYNNVHFKSIDNKITLTKKKQGLGLKKLYSIFRCIPAELRIIFTKDLVILLRKPYFLLKILFFIIIIGSFSSYFSSKIINAPRLLFMYILPSFIVFRLFIHSIGLERNNILLFKQLYPSVFRFLINRVKINLFISSFIVIPIWIIFVVLDPKLLSTNIILRILLSLSNLISCTFLLTGYSAAFAIFKEDIAEHRLFGVSPTALMLYLVLGLCIPLFFYLLDVSITMNVFKALITKSLIISGLISFISIIVFFYMGNRKIKNYF